jgi:hypothetical protein
VGVSIEMQRGTKWVDITPGWRSQMAEWLRDIAGTSRSTMAFTEDDLPALRERRRKQRKGESNPPFDQSDEWVKCFDAIIRKIKKDGVALVQLNY